MSAKEAVLVAGPNLSDADQRIARLIEFFDIRCRMVPATEILALESADGMMPGDKSLVLSGVTLGALLRRPDADRERIRRLIESFGSSLLYSVGPSKLAPDDLRFLTRDIAQGYSELAPDGRFSISDKHRDICGSLSGLTLDRKSRCAQFGLEVNRAAGVDTLIAVDHKAVFARMPAAGSRMFLSTGVDVLDLERRVTSNFDAAWILPGLVPYLMYARDVFTDLIWKPKRHQACLVIDDPLLRRRYGFLNVAELLEVLDKSRCAANLAFIPWNSQRSVQAIANIVRSTDRLALCIHGCDHTRAEFGSHDDAWLDMLVQLALERMSKHQRQTGIVHQKIMVFPHGIFSDRAMSALKRRNFVAAVNTEVVSNHSSVERGKIAMRNLLEMATTVYDSFPLFSRRSLDDPVQNYALDLFLGKPCLLVAHHDDFRPGFKPLKDLVSALNQLEPDLKWTTLGNVLDESFVWRQVCDGVNAVRMYASRIRLENEANSSRRFEITKAERDGSTVDSVMVNENAIPFDWDGRHLRFSCVLNPREEATVRVHYKEPSYREPKKRTLGYRARSGIRRYLSEVRDDYLQPFRHRLLGATR
jgi:hypothetical protein